MDKSSTESGMTNDSMREHIPSLSRRTALLSLTGIAGGSVLGYKTFLTDDEPAFAQTSLSLSKDTLTIDTVEGSVNSITFGRNQADISDGDNSDLEIGYINFREGDFDNGTDEFSVTISLDVYENQGSDGNPSTSGEPTVSGELVSFTVDVDLANFPHNTIETALVSDVTSLNSPVDLTNHGSISDYSNFSITDPALGETKTSTLEFTYSITSSTYDGTHPDETGDPWPDLSASETVATTVTVTTVDETELEVSVGGHVYLNGTAANAPQSTN